MAPEKLVYMANQIARAFAHLPNDQAAKSVAAHIDAFWDPRMRAMLLERVEARDPEIDPRVRRAAEQVRPPQTA
ncbi:formate dehydrogenase delta subunit [Rhodovulum sp. ES.010]|uniref:formate dehydrogenase subunit delta n=1 Tax=Rhodovulum sp. ES.010 TaxID=1882821 RepID=UPI000928DFD7|nr:formate dehydrogenase subunit delta [Rhodovulum sp. ES.010]SIO25309.1 formate dehydrogenase delta subunit [Rhodovulum sp. ES.010]